MRSLGSALGLVLLFAVLALGLGPASAGAPLDPLDRPPPVAGTVADRVDRTSGAGGSGSYARAHGFPTVRTAGVPRGWQPRRTVTGDVTVSKAGAVVEELRIVGGDLIIDAPDVTVRHVEVRGGVIDNFRGGTCQTGLKVRATTIRRAPGESTEGDFPALGVGGYTARRVAILGLPEGFRVGGKSDCGGVKIVNSIAKVRSPDECGDWHGDALQGYDGGALVLRNTVLKLVERDGCGGTAPFFYPEDQGNTSVSVDGLVVEGGGYSFRLGTGGTVTGLHVVAGSYYYGPIDVRCGNLGAWSAGIAELENGGQPVDVRTLRCSTQ